MIILGAIISFDRVAELGNSEKRSNEKNFKFCPLYFFITKYYELFFFITKYYEGAQSTSDSCYSNRRLLIMSPLLYTFILVCTSYDELIVHIYLGFFFRKSAVRVYYKCGTVRIVWSTFLLIRGTCQKSLPLLFFSRPGNTFASKHKVECCQGTTHLYKKKSA